MDINHYNENTDSLNNIAKKSDMNDEIPSCKDVLASDDNKNVTTDSMVPNPLFTSSSAYSHCLPTGLAWSPHADYLAVSSDDAIIRLYSPHLDNEEGDKETSETPIIIKETEYIYNFAWCTKSSRIVATGRYQPVHLWQLGEEGERTPSIAATYKCINQLDELSHAFSVALSQDGQRLFCGLKGEVREFLVDRPGRESIQHKLKQGGIISTIALHPALPVYAAGCYNRSTGLYSTDSGQLLCLLTGQRGGVTQVNFSSDGHRLYTGGRKDQEIVCWDLRQPGKVLALLPREAGTNQRIQFSLSPFDGSLLSANTDGSVRLWAPDLSTAHPSSGVVLPQEAWALHGDAVTGVAWHPSNKRIFATCSGQRHYWEDEGEGEEKTVRVWSIT